MMLMQFSETIMKKVIISVKFQDRLFLFLFFVFIIVNFLQLCGCFRNAQKVIVRLYHK